MDKEENILTVENNPADIWKLYSLQIVIRQINEALLRVKSEPDLFQKVCDLLVDMDGIKFVWIGLIGKDSFDVKPVAQAGLEDNYLFSIKVTWDDSAYGSSPAGTAIKTKQPIVMRDIKHDYGYEPWRKEAMKRGFESSIALPFIHEGEVIGTLNAYSERTNAFKDTEVKFLMEVAGDIAVGVKTLRLEKELKKGLEDLRKALNRTVEAIALMSEMRESYTAGHQRRVALLSCAIAREMTLSEPQIEGISISGLLHDTGKIAIPVEILNKPGKISESEFNIIKTHAQVGYDILKGIEFSWPVVQTVLHHHERLNGSGYPSGFSGEEISSEARILGVADVVEAMSSHRPYRPALGIDKALLEILQNRGTLYDTNVVDACMGLFQKKGFKFD